MKVDKGGKIGVELTIMEGNRNQGVDIIVESMLELLYTRFIMGVGLGFQGRNLVWKSKHLWLESCRVGNWN